ncbi:MAG: hypothetical protein WBF55_04255 [Syntrophobacteria bacterium]
MFHELTAATADMTVLPGVLGCSFDRLRTGSPATYRSGTPRIQPPAVVRLHAHLHGLATSIRETSGLGLVRPGRLVSNPCQGEVCPYSQSAERIAFP